ncbi:testis-expressed protein 2-like isoform X2 [Anneissia japonica]|uniref:testis-expressed protein 2-like isoform X2 n=1 Tax=Anneissia japonica TaxID=1529436 RepID=UPI0014255D0B|nr:testis-expressed protein 2-like isoform X2 [Anneissia japonica]
MSDKKVKPPRPPAPAAKGKKTPKKSYQNGPSITFHYRKDADIENEVDTGVSMVTTSNPSKRESSVEHKVISPKNEIFTKEAIDDPLGATKKTEWNGNSRLDYDVFAESTASRTRKRDADKKQRPTKEIDTGIIRITNEVIAVDDDNNISIPSESKEAISDPLTFVDKLHDNQRKKEAARLEEVKKEERKARLEAALWQKEGEKDSNDLNVNPFYFNVPTPSEVPDEPLRPQSEGAIPLSLSGLLEKSHSDESVKPRELPKKVPGSRTKDSTPPKTPSEDSFSELEKDLLSDVETPSSKQYSKEQYDATFSMAGKQVLIPKYRIIIMSFFIFCYLIFPLPSYLVGLMTGMIASFYCVLFAIWISLPEAPRESPVSPDIRIPLVIPGERMSAPKARAKEQEKIFHQGWLNELPYEYNADTYHIQQTHSVYLRLDGTVLRLLQPKVNVPKRAMWDEALQKPEFIHQRHFDLRGSKVYLLPQGLVSKRTWSKKYPICIEFEKKDTDVQLKDVKVEDEKVEQEVMSDLQGYDFIRKGEFNPNIIYLFARTGREKEEWFWKFETASKYKKIRGKKPIQTLNRSVYLRGNEYTKDDGTRHLHRLDPDDISSRKGAMDFYKYISKILPKEKENAPQSVNVKSSGVTYGSSTRSNSASSKLSPDGGLTESPVSWVNALLGRFFWDFLREEYSKDWVKNKLQKKLSKIRVPRFIDELTITDIDLGLNSPMLRRMSRPQIDERGVWVDLDIAYSGSCCMTLETKVNLWRLKKGASLERELEEISPGMRKMSQTRERQNTAALNSDEEDSAESSDDDEDESQTVSDGTTSQDTESGIKNSSKILRIVNKIASSKYFQNATQYKYVKKAFDEVSSTPILLRVEVKNLTGTLALNIPPPPTNRLWYGFRGKPNLWLSAKPKLGERQVTITHITEFIEKKLELEFQKIFVLPNMDDLVIPIMQGEIETNRF